MRHFLGDRLNTPLFENHFTGVLVVDPVSRDTLFRQNSSKYFTPASNTKIFTLYAALKLLPPQMPALRYADQGDTLYIQGTGDPSLLHPYFRDSTVFHFLKNQSRVALYQGNMDDTHWGPGWAWEDYDGYYSPDRTALPLYGNVVFLRRNDSLLVEPAYFRENVHQLQYPYRRIRDANEFFYPPGRSDSLYIPIKTDTALTRLLLEAALGKKLHTVRKLPDMPMQTLPGIPTDSLLKRMMQESDNFLAEQLLLAASGMLSDTLNGQKAREHILEQYLPALPQPPVWVDGSGLSRYNLFSPEDMVYVLHRLYLETDTERLLSLFPAGGVSGTISDWYGQEGDPYVFAKTGTLANNHCLSGYLRTRSGKFLIFSFMHNHFQGSSSGIKTTMQQVLEKLYRDY